MSDDHSSNKPSSGVSLLGNLLAIGIPILMVVMLGLTGAAFLIDYLKGDPKEKESKAVATTAKAKAPAAAESAPDLMALGKTTYGTCGACHGMDGKGLKVGPMLMAPSLTGSEIVNGDPDRMALVVLKGLKKESTDFMGVMTPLAAMLDDEKLAAVMTYVRASFGNKSAAVSVDTAKKARERFAKLTDPTGISRAKIDEIIAAHK
ncbi:MAG: c-type cytochrome [Verrucomicrobiales bacterium]|nr:c-type cytochrome [Verrucomicrobiales bacterium]